MRYTVIIEKTENNFGAWAPDLPGCVTTGPTVAETLSNMQEAIEFHLDGLREDGEQIPELRTVAAVVEIARVRKLHARVKLLVANVINLLYSPR
jgi:predicted RNase H-like HicB family nuclease